MSINDILDGHVVRHEPRANALDNKRVKVMYFIYKWFLVLLSITPTIILLVYRFQEAEDVILPTPGRACKLLFVGT